MISQKSAFIDQELVTAGTCGQHVLAFAASGQSNSFAFSLSGSPNRLQLVCLRDAPQFTTLEQQRPTTSCAYSNAAISADGRHLLAFCGPAQPYVELWALSPLQLLLTVDVLFQGTGMLSHPLQACSQAWAAICATVCVPFRQVSVILPQQQHGYLLH